MMKNNFDKNIEELLKDYRVEYDPESWDRLERKLSREEKDDAIFDTIIAQKLKSYAAVPVGASFARFEKKLNGDNKGFNKQKYYFVGVAAALVLLISTVFFLNNDKSNTNSFVKDNNARYHQKDDAITQNKKTVIENAEHILNNTEPEAPSNASIAIVALDNSPISKNTLKIHNKMYDEVYNNTTSINYGLQNAFNSREYRGFNNDFYGAQSYPIVPYETKPDMYISVNFDVYMPAKESLDYKTKKQNTSVAAQDINARQAPAGTITVNKDSINNIALLDTKEPGAVFNAYMCYNANHVSTPNDLILNIPGYTQIANNYGAGASISFRKNKNELELGLEYNKCSYTPKAYPMNAGGASFVMKNINYDIMSIPVNYKRQLVSNDKWEISAMGGVSANLVVNTDYRFIEEQFGGNNGDFKLTKYAEELQNNNNFKKTLYYKKEYTTGVLDGGDINNNFYLTLNTGVELRRKLNKNYSIYLEPSFHLSSNSLGPNNDNINTFSLKFGVSKSLNVKS